MLSSTPAGSDFAGKARLDDDAKRRKQLKPESYWLEPAIETPLAARVRSRRVGQAVAATSQVSADCAAFIGAAILASVLIRLAGRWVPMAGGPLADLVRHANFPGEALILIGVLIAFARNGHYWRRMPFWSALRDMLGISVAAMLCAGFLEYSSHQHDSRIFLVLTWLMFPLIAALLRSVARNMLSRIGMWQMPVLIVGSGEAAEQARTALQSEPGLGYQVVDMVDADAEMLLCSQHLNQPSYWRRLLQRRNADMLVLALDPNVSSARVLTESLVRARVPFSTMPRLDGLPVLGYGQTSFFSHDTVMFSYRNNLAKPGARAAKIVFDLTMASLLLLLSAPVLLVIASAVKLDGGPILFAHRRIGANGREFSCFKFRSMVPDAEAVLRLSLAEDADLASEWEDGRKLRRDPRVTAVGRFLRATSLDELPQLFNVLRLEMSLVGPRPIVRAEVMRYAEDIAYYYETRPGLTGLWQVSGRSDTTYSQRVQLDTWYVKNWTIWHDVAILAKTIPTVLKRQGAL